MDRDSCSGSGTVYPVECMVFINAHAHMPHASEARVHAHTDMACEMRAHTHLAHSVACTMA